VLSKNLRSQELKSLISFIQYLIAIILVIHKPNANHLYFFESISHSLRTFGCIIQAQKISIHQVHLHKEHHFHQHIGQETSHSKPGSTNGKYAGLSLIFIEVQKTFEKNFSKNQTKCATDIFSSITIHSNCQKVVSWLASVFSFLKTFQGSITLQGALYFFITSFCQELV